MSKKLIKKYAIPKSASSSSDIPSPISSASFPASPSPASVSSPSATPNLTSSEISSSPASSFQAPLLPRLVVFDLDYTLWPFWVDTHITPPIRPAPAPLPASRSAATTAVDRWGEAFDLYPDVPRILWGLSQQGVRIAVASRTTASDLARDMLKTLALAPPQDSDGAPAAAAAGGRGAEKPRRLLDLFDGGLEIYPSSKLRHMEALARRNAVAFEDVLFFDDERRNAEVESLGVTMYLVRDGMSWAEFVRGLERWRRRRHAGPVGEAR